MIQILLFWILASILNACMDVNFNEYAGSVFSRLNPAYWNPTVSWKNKWKDGDESHGEKFFGSSTFLSFLTDSWHLFKFLYQCCLIVCIYFAFRYAIALHIRSSFLELVAVAVVLAIFHGAFFELTRRILK